MTFAVPTSILYLLTCAILMLVAALIAATYRDWQALLVDDARARLFAARDQIFLLFAASELGTGHPAHRTVRATLNSLIRYAHRTTVLTFIVASLLPAGAGRGPEVLLRNQLAGNPELLRLVEAQLVAGYLALFELIVKRSLLLLPMRLVTGARLQAVSWLAALVRRRLDSMAVMVEDEERLPLHAGRLRGAA